MKNSVRAALRDGRVTFGSWITFGHTGLAEVMAQAGFEWLTIDLEHSVIGIDMVQPLIQVIELSGCVPLVRLSSNDPVLTKRVMDAGAHGVIVPSVNSREEAEAAVRSVKYPPAGRRGFGLARAQGYGVRVAEYIRDLESFGIVIAMIETREGVEQVEKIVRVPGVDGIFIGPYDLAASCGVPGQLDHPRVRDACQHVVAAAREAGVAAGLHVVHPTDRLVETAIEDGFQFIAIGVDMIFLGQQCREVVAKLRTLPSWRGAGKRDG